MKIETMYMNKQYKNPKQISQKHHLMKHTYTSTLIQELIPKTIPKLQNSLRLRLSFFFT